MKIINAAAFAKAVKQVEAGKFGVVESKDFEIPFTETKPLESYKRPINFPNCCNFHKQAYTYAKEVIDTFPNCCEDHKKLLKTSWYNKKDYQKIPDKVLNTLSYTEHHITTQINNPDWYEDITQYIEYSCKSFGQLPAGFGNPIGIALYYTNIGNWVLWNDKIDTEKRDKITAYLEGYFKPKKNAEIPDINILIDVYKKWLKVFPFSISYFIGLKEKFEKIFPPLLKEIPITNKYNGYAKSKMRTQSELIDFLINTTKHLLQQVNAIELLQGSHITDKNKHTIELINEDLRIKNELLLGEYSKDETKYLRILKKWLTYQKEYFRDIANIIKTKPEPLETKTDILKKVFGKYGFYELEMVKSLSDEGTEKLIKILIENKLPYQIAMIDFLDFIAHLEKQHFQSKYKLYKELAKWFGSDKEGRAIKGNISSLISKTTENKDRYTAYLHKETVKKDYAKLK